MIFYQGNLGSTLFILKSELVKVHLIGKDGREIILRILDENDFFGEMSLLDGKFRTATIIALEDSKALLILREEFIRLIRRHPVIATNILAAIIRRFKKTDEKLSGFYLKYLL